MLQLLWNSIMFELRAVSKFFTGADGVITVLDTFSCTFEPGIAYGITGPSGAGKTTLLNLLIGIDAPSSGSIFFEGNDIAPMATHATKAYEQFLRSAVGVVFQNPFLVPELSLVDTIGFKGLLMGMPRAEIVARVEQLAQALGLKDFLSQPVTLLSGGQQQRVALARALFVQPKFLLIDEPTAHLDNAHARSIVQLLKNIQKESGCGLIVASHDPLVIDAMEIRVDLGLAEKNFANYPLSSSKSLERLYREQP